jgi:hypothetical protein
MQSKKCPAFAIVGPRAQALLVLFCCIPSAWAAGGEIAGFALTPFFVGLLGGAVTGMFERASRGYKFGVAVWFAVWILLFTVIVAASSAHPLEAVPNALAVSAFSGLAPFAIFFAIARFVTARLRAFIVSRRKQ